jgi:hypothetical protein
MKLSEWARESVWSGGPEAWARQVMTKAIEELGTGEDPVVFSTYEAVTRDVPRATIRLWAALAVGLTTVSVVTDPIESVDARLALSVEPWSVAGPTLRLEMSGDPEARLPVSITIGAERVEVRASGRAPILAFFVEANRIATS